MSIRVVLVLLLFLLFAIGAYREGFTGDVVAANEEIARTNDGTQPWNRHPVNSIAYLQMRPAFQRGVRNHMNAGYYEIDNYTYDIAVKKAFAYGCQAELLGGWGEVTTPSTTAAPAKLIAEYDKMLAILQSRLRTSPQLRTVQIVHDRWIGIQKHITHANVYMLSMEVILYQQGKFQGKHVSLSVLVDQRQIPTQYTVTQSRVEGVVAEDQIGMFPILANEHNVSGADYVSVPNDPLMPYPTRLIDPTTIETIVNAQKNNLNRSVAAQLLV